MKPEDFKKNQARPLTGEEYLESLRDNREIYINGERVEDVTTHPAFRNSAASMAKLYDALHDPAYKDTLCWETDTGNGGYTHKFFRYAKSAQELKEQQGAIEQWAKLTYGWMGRTPDYKAAFGNVLGINPSFYGEYENNARTWYKRIQESCLYLNHAIVNPPIDRHKPVSEVEDVYIKVNRETKDGIYVSGAKVVATNSALTHYTFIGQGSAQVMGENPHMALMFICDMNAPGMKLICRGSYEQMTTHSGGPFDYPLSSRFDENDAILILDDVFIPRENILINQDPLRCKRWFVEGGFGQLFPMQGAIRLGVKLDFLTGLLHKSLECTGTLEFRGVKAEMGQVVGWRNMIWSCIRAMYACPESWYNDSVLPNAEAIHTYRVFAPQAYNDLLKIVKTSVASGLIYLPSGSQDIKNDYINSYLEKYVRGSNGIESTERIKILKLMWDAVGSEFGGRHALYELNYAGSAEEVKMQCLGHAQRSGSMERMIDLVTDCLADYDVDGWTDKASHLNPITPSSKVNEIGEATTVDAVA
ncbi:4-hydroxyphenylacetate 3-monooxygenase, oxygenase component [Pseudoalteromonas sp. MSK9-3]|nr:4-hydroxyphenylacetate 3-monooxygenase, oxygenase component [Pseudoalteromonas sp. MSK9-3]